jgi:anti-anti-sigma factor
MRLDPRPLAADLARGADIATEFPNAGLAIVRLIGEHDLGAFEALREALDMAVSRRRHVCVDLSRCAFIDSTVVSLLLYAQGEVVSDRGQFALIVPEQATAVRRIAAVMGLAQMFPIYTSPELLPVGDAGRAAPTADARPGDASSLQVRERSRRKG